LRRSTTEELVVDRAEGIESVPSSSPSGSCRLWRRRAESSTLEKYLSLLFYLLLPIALFTGWGENSKAVHGGGHTVAGAIVELCASRKEVSILRWVLVVVSGLKKRKKFAIEAPQN
jgi:hypothetical protein